MTQKRFLPKECYKKHRFYQLRLELVIFKEFCNFTSKRLLLYGTSHIDVLQNCYDTCYFLRNLVIT